MNSLFNCHINTFFSFIWINWMLMLFRNIQNKKLTDIKKKSILLLKQISIYHLSAADKLKKKQVFIHRLAQTSISKKHQHNLSFSSPLPAAFHLKYFNVTNQEQSTYIYLDSTFFLLIPKWIFASHFRLQVFVHSRFRIESDCY